MTEGTVFLIFFKDFLFFGLVGKHGYCVTVVIYTYVGQFDPLLFCLLRFIHNCLS